MNWRRILTTTILIWVGATVFSCAVDYFFGALNPAGSKDFWWYVQMGAYGALGGAIGTIIAEYQKYKRN